MPLVLRANKGDRLIIELENLIANRRVGIHLYSDGYNVTSDGSAVGRNLPSLVDFGAKREFVWDLNNEGPFLFQDAGDLSGRPSGTHAHGLWGAVIVEEVGATWTDPQTGENLVDGLYADIHPLKTR